MSRLAVRFGLVGALVWLGPAVQAADPPEALPVPRMIPPAVAVPEPVIHAYPGYYRTSRYAVWDYYGVDRSGKFRPRVIYSPYGPYYLYTGEPFPWATMYQRSFMPYIVDSP